MIVSERDTKLSVAYTVMIPLTKLRADPLAPGTLLYEMKIFYAGADRAEDFCSRAVWGVPQAYPSIIGVGAGPERLTARSDRIRLGASSWRSCHCGSREIGDLRGRLEGRDRDPGSRFSSGPISATCAPISTVLDVLECPG